MFKMPRTAKYIDMIVRMGRKVNIMFVFVSQRVDDIASDSGGIGKTIDNMATKIMLGLNEQAADDVAKIPDAPGVSVVAKLADQVSPRFDREADRER